MTPLERYQQDLLRPGFQQDPAQRYAIERLQMLFKHLVNEQQAQQQKASLKAKFSALFVKAPEAKSFQGLYFWGGVGRGKTYLMDIFFDCLPFENKMRSHFHRFMQFVHEELRLLEGTKNPLDIVAEKIARQARVICFDEFFVSDITDAMILGGLFEKLFDLGVTLVATSNIVPADLYKNGLQRQRFLPAIEQINKHCEVVNIDCGVDYRLRALEQAELYYYPLGSSAEASLMKSLLSLAPDSLKEQVDVLINHRHLFARYEADDIVWFEFAELCDGPRSQNDYIELARIYHAVIISNVPCLNADKEDQARRFINLVDEFYDRNVKLVISAAVDITSLYSGAKLQFEFERTQSRLLEMQSREYLAAEHRP
jgi:cell division protein ZapE